MAAITKSVGFDSVPISHELDLANLLGLRNVELVEDEKTRASPPAPSVRFVDLAS